MKRNYTIEFMGYDGTDMYSVKVSATDIEEAYNEGMKLIDREDDRIISICEDM